MNIFFGKGEKKTPGIKNKKKEDKSPFSAPDGFWNRCPSCGEIQQQTKIEENFEVCPHCEHHFRVSARKKIEWFCDPGSFVEQDKDLISQDVLNFVDTKPYHERLKATQKKTEINDAYVSGSAKLDGKHIEVGAFEFSFMGGSMGMVVGEKVSRVFDRAYKKKRPVVLFQSSGGARMQEGILSLMQMAKTTASYNQFKSLGLPYFSVLSDPTTGGVAASFAFLGDFIISEPGALIGFAGPRVIAQTINQNLPEGFQRAEFLLEHGMIDKIVSRKELRPYVVKMLSLLMD